MSDIRTIQDIEVGRWFVVRVAENGEEYEATVIKYPGYNVGSKNQKSTSEAPRVIDPRKWVAIGKAIDRFEGESDE